MAILDETPTFNLKAVIQETGLKPDTLRAWERRYNLPQPDRTPGGHRLYSQREIETLKWLVARQEEGLSISRAVALWKQLEAEGQDPLLDPTYALPEAASHLAFVPEGDTINELREAWLSACLGFDEVAAEQVVTYGLALFPAQTVCFEILLKGLAEIGKGWYGGKIAVQQEHFASELAMRRLEAMLAAAPAPTRSGRILVGCAPEEAHTFPALVLTFMLRQRGWPVVYLGARVPLDRMEATVDTVRPHLVILTAQQLTTAATLLEVAQFLGREEITFAFGGRIFNLLRELRKRIPGHFLGERLEAAPQLVEQLMTSSPALPTTETTPERFHQALANFREHRNLLEAEMWQRMEGMDITPDYLAIANQALAHNISAALTLGDLDFLCTDIEWVEGLLDNFDLPKGLLQQYLTAYYRTAREYLDTADNPVLTWLSELHRKDTEHKE
jgi:DNA-binding transcriptional MerR regulator/methylmalonyl-CoA mutase cobalamin-binding subunit